MLRVAVYAPGTAWGDAQSRKTSNTKYSKYMYRLTIANITSNLCREYV